jgi:acyl-coenzyme A synthetase/AMP-(fatty) acid ligase
MYQGYRDTDVLPIAMMDRARLQLRNEDNKPVQRGMAGEIVARCDRRMRGFWNDAEATAEHRRWLATSVP